MELEGTSGMLAADADDQEADDAAADSDERSVDWEALWEEFGFDSPDACGNHFASPTQLRAALECSEQNCPTGDGVIKQAVREGPLKKLQKANHNGDLAVRGYALPEVMDDE